MSQIRTRRLTSDDRELARDMIITMAKVFDEPYDFVSDAYLGKLLSRADFWAIAALVDGEIAGGLTAYTLPMTRTETSEVFIYDIAVREDHQRKGIGRLLIAALLEEARAEGIEVLFVPADNEDTHALEFYRALGGVPQAVTIFTFSPSG